MFSQLSFNCTRGLIHKKNLKLHFRQFSYVGFIKDAEHENPCDSHTCHPSILTPKGIRVALKYLPEINILINLIYLCFYIFHMIYSIIIRIYIIRI